jgi:Kef-type K+ transport system membrane component KefB
VGIIVAGIGATAGVVEDQLFAVIVGMSVLTTLLIPPLLRRALDVTPAPPHPGDESLPAPGEHVAAPQSAD